MMTNFSQSLSLDLPRKSTEFCRKYFRGVFGRNFDDSAEIDGKLSNKEFYGIMYKCRGIHGILLQNLRISAADSMDFCRGFYRILPQISRTPATESPDLISAEV